MIDDILTLHRIDYGPPKLRKSFYTTNVIDSAFLTPKFRVRRIKRWRKSNDMIKMWAGSYLLQQEKTFRKVNTYGMIEEFLTTYLSLDEKIAAKH